MVMKSRKFSLFIALCLGLNSFLPLLTVAGEVSRNQAVTIASKVVQDYFPSNQKSLASSIEINANLKSNEPFFVCNVGQTGFVLIAKDDNCPPILGFSWEGTFPENLNNAPELINTIVNNIRRQCADFAGCDTVNPAVEQAWNTYSSKKSTPITKTGIISPLLATSWNVDGSFFDLFPKDYRSGGSVPIAMGQVFRFYGQPTSGTGELCYVLNGFGEWCINFTNARLNFSSMSNTLGNSAVDSLIYYMSATCMLQPEGASMEAYKQTLPIHFGYSTNMRSVESWNYNLGEVIHHQLSLRRPVPAEWLGLTFVIDGYFPDNLFHFNVGMGGEFNGYYLLDYPVVKVDTDHSLLTCYTDYHPASQMPGVTDVAASTEGDSVRISWNTSMSDSLKALLVRYVVLRDGLIPIAETRDLSVAVSLSAMGGSAPLRVVADFGLNGASELSAPFLYLSNQNVADIASLSLRQLINTKLGSSDLLRQPFVGELDLIRDLEINFPDQRGLEKLPMLKNLRINGTNIRTLRDGDYLKNLNHLRFYQCVDFDYTIFGKTRSLYQLYGYDYLPFDLYEFRHNTDLGLLIFTSTGTNPNMLMDLYGADKYFPKLADFYVRHLSAGISASYEDCFVSIESYLDIYPKIKSNLNLLMRTKPTTFAPCYPVPARNTNIPSVSRLSWQSNTKDEAGVYYNVFVGNNRRNMELVSVFQSDKFYDGTFETNSDYYWRVEAYHVDSTYYSGIYHFSTYEDLPIPFVERFDDFYSACNVAEESPFWTTFDTKLTGKALTSRNIKFDGIYSLEMKPKSDAGLLIVTPTEPNYFIEFRFLNQNGELAVELLQKSGSSDDQIVNAKIEFLGKETGLFTYGTTSFTFNFVPDVWNRVNVAMNMSTGAASFSLNEALLKEWQWHVQIGGTANTNPFKGIRFVNNAPAAGGSGFIDNLIIDVMNPLSVNPVVVPEIALTYLNDTREVVVTGIQTEKIREFALCDLQGRKLLSVQSPDNLRFSVGSSLPNGVYLVVVSPTNGLPYSRKIAVLD
jgi:hypothetical protein